MEKLCYIVPEYNSASPSHFSYLNDWVNNLKKYFNLFLISEDDGKFKMLLSILRAYSSGYRDFYIHYSFLGALASSLLTRCFGGRTFYWNCGLPWNYKRNIFRDLFERMTYKTVTFLVTGTEGLKKEYAEHYGLSLDKIKVMPNWINIDSIKYQISNIKTVELREELNIKDQKLLLFVHRLSRRKGAHYLPKILDKLRDENIVMVIIGDGPERDLLKLEINNLKLEDKVRFLGWVPHDQIISYFAAANIFIMPSEEEGFPHVLLEAMVLGIPFVAFNVGGVGEMLASDLSECVIESGSINDFVGAVKRILSDQKLFLKISENEKNYIKIFNTHKVIEIFRKMLVNNSL
ncbi:MAG: glycosyltransferase family 4 protein [bacterium]|nr:glycosyltransferase family 4 protein [bacterium]